MKLSTAEPAFTSIMTFLNSRKLILFKIKQNYLPFIYPISNIISFFLERVMYMRVEKDCTLQGFS